MKKQIKRLTLALIAVGLSSPVWAGAFDVTVPNQNGGIVVGATGLFLTAGANNTTYGATGGVAPFTTVSGISTVTTTNVSGTSLDTNPNYHWAFGVQLGYLFPGTGNDITASWTHLNSHDTGSVNAGSGGTITPFPQGNSAAEAIAATTGGISVLSSGNGKTSYKMDAVDLMAGQRIFIGSDFNLRLSAGLEYARLQNTISNVFTGAIPQFITAAGNYSNAIASYQSSETSTFNGLGPKAAFDGRFCFGDSGFGFDSNLNGGLLIGNISVNQSSTANSFATINTRDPVTGAKGVTTATFTNSATGLDTGTQNRRVVPFLGANLGVDYMYKFNNAAQSSLTAELGYQAVNYFNSNRTINPEGSLTNINFTDHGPFLTVKFLA